MAGASAFSFGLVQRLLAELNDQHKCSFTKHEINEFARSVSETKAPNFQLQLYMQLVQIHAADGGWEASHSPQVPCHDDGPQQEGSGG